MSDEGDGGVPGSLERRPALSVRRGLREPYDPVDGVPAWLVESLWEWMGTALHDIGERRRTLLVPTHRIGEMVRVLSDGQTDRRGGQSDRRSYPVPSRDGGVVCGRSRPAVR